MDADIDPARFAVHHADPRASGRRLCGKGKKGGVPLVCIHGWPETKRIFWRVIEPLAAAGFEVIVPDLRGFGECDVGPDGFHDVPATPTTSTRSCTRCSATNGSSSSAATSAAR